MDLDMSTSHLSLGIDNGLETKWKRNVKPIELSHPKVVS